MKSSKDPTVSPCRVLLIAAGYCSFGIAAFHIAIVLVGPRAYRYFGAGEQMANQAAAGSPTPALLTILIAVVFTVFAFYGFAGAGNVKPAPLLKPGLLVIGLIYLVRGSLAFAEVTKLVRAPGSVPHREVIFSITALVVGLLYTVGTVAGWRSLGGSADA